MAVMTIADAWPTTSRAFAVEDLDHTPDDGFRYELIDGVLIVSPHPTVSHQEVLAQLAVQLRHACPPGLFAVPAPGVRMSADTELVPDIGVIPRDQLTGRRVTRTPAPGATTGVGPAVTVRNRSAGRAPPTGTRLIATTRWR